MTHRSGKRASYASLAAKAAGVDIGVADVRLKSPRDFKLIGTAQPRRDSAGATRPAGPPRAGS